MPETPLESRRSERVHRKHVTRLVWHLNHGEDARLWRHYAMRGGYRVRTLERSTHQEHHLLYDDRVVALLHEWPDEAFGFVFLPEAAAPWFSRVWWRMTHPTTPLRDLPWPRRDRVAS